MSAFFGTVAIALGTSVFHETGLTTLAPHIFRTGNFFVLFSMPLSYLYVRSIVTGRSPGKLDLLHALPALFYLIDFLPFFLLPAGQKLEVFQQTFGDRNAQMAYAEGWITPPQFHRVFRTILIAGYWGAQVWLLAKLFKFDERKVLFRENREWLRFIFVLTALQFLMFFPPC